MGSSAGKKDGGASLGATARTALQVSGPNGGIFRAPAYRCVNVTTDPQLREALLSGALYEIESPEGDGVYRLAFPVCYHDEKLELFALVVPPALRHREFEFRIELLSELADESGAIPAYIRAFETVIGADELQALESRRATGELVADGGGRADTEPSAEASVDEEQRDRLEQERAELRAERSRLDELAERLERERAHLDDFKQELELERESLEGVRSEVEAMKLNLEQQRMRAEQGAPQSNAEESTQVVTDDQFVEVVDVDDAEPPAQAEEATELIDSPYADVDPTVLDEARIRSIDPELVGGGDLDNEELDADRAVVEYDGRILAAARVSSESIEHLEAAESLSFFVQYDQTHGYPLVGLVLAGLDDEQQEAASVGWPLDVAGSEDSDVLDRLEEGVELEVLLDAGDGPSAGFAVAAPLHENIAWIRQRAQQRLEDASSADASFEDASHAWADPEKTRLGTMRHNFQPDSFEELDGPAATKLAAGIVGYWATSEQYEYLVANRSFAIAQFEAIKQRVVRRAVEQGLVVNEPLRQVAVDAGLADDERELIERLVSEYAELNVGLRENDLDPIEQWENWEALVELAEGFMVTLDPEVLELAEASLKRAQEFQEVGDLEQPDAPDGPAPSQEQAAEEAAQAVDVDQLVVARRSETTGVTYFLPDDAVLDTFDDLASMTREDLELLLDDAKGRLEAAQMLIERFGADGTRTALEGAEQMTSAEVVALARFLETKAEGLEAELVRCVESAGASATYVAARALASIRSASAMPTLLEAFRDDERGGDRRNLARALAGYGQKLLPALKRAIKEDGHDEATLVLIDELERQHEGVLAELAKDRSKKVRTAASAVRSK